MNLNIHYHFKDKVKSIDFLKNVIIFGPIIFHHNLQAFLKQPNQITPFIYPNAFWMLHDHIMIIYH